MCYVFVMKKPTLPERIICLTEEAVELLYLLEEEDRIVGVSQFAVRPQQVKREKPVVSVFTHANQKKVLDLTPDLILGYSDIQKDIAKNFIELGQNVWISNHRSLQETLNYCAAISAMVGKSDRFEQLASQWLLKIEDIRERVRVKGKRFRVYLEEWDEPRISGIRYFSELMEICGFDDINSHLRNGNLAKDRFPQEEHILNANPEIIFACWCGKKVDIESIKEREGWSQLSAISQDRVFELPPEVFLQPGPALFESGLDLLWDYYQRLL